MTNQEIEESRRELLYYLKGKIAHLDSIHICRLILWLTDLEIQRQEDWDKYKKQRKEAEGKQHEELIS